MRIRTAILGYGRNGSTMHANPIEKYDDLFEVVAICDIDPVAKEKAKERFGCPIYHDYHDMLTEINPELVVIVTRSHQHAQMTIDCLMAGSNVLVTKPWATNTPDAIRMIDAAKKSGKKLLPWLPARWGYDVKWIAGIIKNGDIGKVTEIRRNVSRFTIRNDWQTQLKYGGGYLLNWGPHLIDQPLELTDRNIKCVWADVKQLINPNDGEDDYHVIIKMENGVTVFSEHETTIYPTPSWIVKGDRGTIVVSDNKIKIHKATIPSTIDESNYGNEVNIETVEETIKGNIYGDEFEIYPHIASVIRGECEYFATLESALLLSRIIDAAKLSSQTGKAVMF